MVRTLALRLAVCLTLVKQMVPCERLLHDHTAPCEVACVIACIKQHGCAERVMLDLSFFPQASCLAKLTAACWQQTCLRGASSGHGAPVLTPLPAAERRPQTPHASGGQLGRPMPSQARRVEPVQ